MPSSYTTNYKLNQWVRSDRVLMEDFNADNAKIDAALADLEARLARSERANRNIAYYIEELGARELESSGKAIGQLALGIKKFDSTGHYSDMSGVKVIDGAMHTIEEGGTGSFSFPAYSIYATDWTQAHIIVVTAGGSLTLEINGQTLPLVSRFSGRTPAGSDCFAWEYLWKRTAKDSMTFTVNMKANASGDMVAYALYYFVS